MASSPDSRPLSQDNHDSRAEPEKKPYEPPAIEYEEEFERVMLTCCFRNMLPKGGGPNTENS